MGLSPFGQYAVQLPIPLQRNTLNGSSSFAKRSVVAVSRESSKNRWACSSPAGPTYFSGFHHQEGQADEQQAHRMHSYKPSSFARSSGLWSRSIAGRGWSFISHG